MVITNINYYMNKFMSFYHELYLLAHGLMTDYQERVAAPVMVMKNTNYFMNTSTSCHHELHGMTPINV